MEHAPGCFAAASVYDPHGTICSKCPYAEPCAVEAKATLQRIRERINVSDLLKKHVETPAVPTPPTVITPPAVPAVSAKVVPAPAVKMIPKPVARVTPLEPVKVAVMPGDAEILAKLPVKPRELAERLIRSGRMYQIREALAKRLNPFAAAKPEYLRVTFDALLTGGCSKSDLKKRFQEELGWSDGTASSHVGIATSFVTGFGLVLEVSGWLELR